MSARAHLLRPLLPVLCLVLACLSLPAWAGHWSVNYSVKPNGGNGFPIGPNFSGSYNQTLTVTATLTWANVYPGEVPPKTVSYVESASASANGKTTLIPPKYGLVNPKPICDNGLNDPSVLDSTNNATQCYATSQGAHLVQKPYSSPLVLPTRTLSAGFTCDSAHSDAGSGSVGMTYSVVTSDATLGGHSTVDTSAPGNPWDPTHPRFFSGTNCHADAYAYALSLNSFVKRVQLMVSGTLTKEYDDVASLPTNKDPNVIYSSGTSQPSVGLTTYFDSSHFADALPIPVQMIVTDTGGNKYDSQIKASAYNEAYVGYEASVSTYGQPTAGVVDSAMGSCNIGQNDSSPTDTRDAVLAAVKFNTVFFTYSHGQDAPDAANHVYFEAPAGVGNSNGLIYPNKGDDPSSTTQTPRDDVAEAVTKKGVNPPPYNFVYLDICNGALNTEFADGFGVSATGNTDRALLGWGGLVEDSAVNQQWTQLLYSYLQSGQTLTQALANADKIPGGPPQEENPNSPNYKLPCSHPVKGDGAMTLHSVVYQGTKWFR